MSFEIRTATAADVGVVLHFIRALAEYEKLSHICVATEESILRTVFGADSNVRVLLLEELETSSGRRHTAGFALYFYNYSTFLSKKGIYLEDIFVLPEYRGKGYGKALMVALAKRAVAEDCGRFEWSVLDWNEPSIQFYRSLGAVSMDEWT